MDRVKDFSSDILGISVQNCGKYLFMNKKCCVKNGGSYGIQKNHL